MKTSTALQRAGLAALALTRGAAAVSGLPEQPPTLGKYTSQGCFSDGGSLKPIQNDFQSSAGCSETCEAAGYWVAGVSANICACGDKYPPEDAVVDDTKCNYPCPAWDQEACGSEDGKYWGIFNTGIEVLEVEYEESSNDDNEDEDEQTSSSAPSSTAQSSSTAPTSSPSDTQTSSADENEDSGDDEGGPNVAAIAAGVVVGVVVIAAAIGGGVFYMRRKRNAEIEEEHRRNAAVNAFISGAKPPSSAGSVSMTDSRLDPVLARRRLSDGSIADNEDYSRRILRVTNA